MYNDRVNSDLCNPPLLVPRRSRLASRLREALDRISVLSNSSNYSLAISPNYEEKISSVEPVNSKPTVLGVILGVRSMDFIF